MNRPYLIANWKMNLTLTESVEVAAVIGQGSRGVAAEVVVCPAFPNIAAVAEVFKETVVSLGAQDVAAEERGSYTGEVSAAMLKAVGCRYVIVGHSERRRRFQETNALVNAKLRRALQHELTPILCVGETKEERDAGEANRVVSEQVAEALAGVEHDSGRIIIAYEPVWAISPSPPAKSADALVMLPVIQEAIARQTQLHPDGYVVVYGGSVAANNVASFVGPGRLAGVLVGKESLSGQEFLAIIATAAAAYVQ